jgi:hypothetical protein
MATAVFICRQLVAFFFVLCWLVATGIDLFLVQDAELIPFWFHGIGVSVLAYALGMNVADITAFRITAPQVTTAPPR